MIKIGYLLKILLIINLLIWIKSEGVVYAALIISIALLNKNILLSGVYFILPLFQNIFTKNVGYL